MLGDGRWTMRQGAAQMRRHTLAAQENLDGLLGDPCLDLLTYEVMGNTVEPISKFPTAVDPL